MARVAKVAVDLEANSAKFTSGLGKADAALAASARKWDRTLSQMDSRMSAVGTAMGAAFAGLSVGATVNQLYSVNAEFQRLGASLKTVTGSTEGAQAAMKMIQSFATETPYKLTEVTDAFIKLKALGLDASIDSLRSYGNTASALGKPMNMMIEAVADAATGEFERLKEFGIKASSEGDKVKFTFQGVTTTIQKDAASIEGYLRSIGEIQFAGAMGEQMATLGGQASNLGDQFDALMTAIGQAGANDAMSYGLVGLTGVLKELTEQTKLAGEGFKDWDTRSVDRLQHDADLAHERIAALRKELEGLKGGIGGAIGDIFSADMGALFSGNAIGHRRRRIESEIGAEQNVAAYSAVRMAEADPDRLANVRPEARPAAVVSEPSKEATTKNEAIAKQIQALQFQEAQLSRTSREQAIYSALQTAGVSATSAQGQAVSAAAAKLYDKTEAVKAAKEAQDRLNQSEAEAWDVAMKQTEARDGIAASMNEEVANNERLIAALQVSEAEYERVAAAIDLVNQYKAAGVTMTAEELANIDEVSAKLGEQRAEMDKMKDAAAEGRRSQADLTRAIGTATEDAILKAQSLREVLAGLLQDIAKIAMRAAITKPLEGMFGSMFSSAGGGFSNIMGGGTWGSSQPVAAQAIGADINSAGLGGFATGTNNAPPGMAWVGERGPELMRFKGGEQVYPSGLSKQIAAASTRGFADGAFAMPSATTPAVNEANIGAAGGGVSITNYVEGGASMADVENAVMTGIRQAAPQIVSAAVQQSVPMSMSAMRNSVNRGGSDAKTFGRL